MAEIAQELDDEIMEIVKQQIKRTIEFPHDIAVTCLAVDIIHELNEAGYIIVRRQ